MYFWKSYRHPNFIKYICPLTLYAFAFNMLLFSPMYHSLHNHPNKEILNPIDVTSLYFFNMISHLHVYSHCFYSMPGWLHRLLIGHKDSRLSLFKCDLCFTPLYCLFHLLQKQLWCVHFHDENYPVAAIGESKELVIVSKTFPVQAFVICAAIVLSWSLFML